MNHQFTVRYYTKYDLNPGSQFSIVESHAEMSCCIKILNQTGDGQVRHQIQSRLNLHAKCCCVSVASITVTTLVISDCRGVTTAPPAHTTTFLLQPIPALPGHYSIKAAELVSCEGFQPGLKIYFTCLTSESQVQWCAGGKRVVVEATISEIISKLWLSDKNFIVG